MEELITIDPQHGLLGGLFPSAQKTSGPVWDTGRNVLFRELSIDSAPVNERFGPYISRGPQSLAQAFVSGVKRLYFENNGLVNYWDGISSHLIGTVAQNGAIDLEPFGSWLAVTDSVNQPKLWKNSGTFINIGSPRFTKAKILIKQQQHLLAYGTDVLPNGFHWCSADDPELWVPATNNTAGDLPIRELDSDVIAVVPLGAIHAVYSRESLALVQWIGGQNVFGQRLALQGVGACSKYSVVSFNNKNYGISRAGIFETDGLGFLYYDRPAFNEYLKNNVNWELGDLIFGYYNELLNLVIWKLPTLDGETVNIGFDPVRKTFTKLDDDITAAIERQVFDFPIIAGAAGLFYAGNNTQSAARSALTSKPLPAGSISQYKSWSHILLEGELGNGLELRVGYSDTTQATPEWTTWTQAVAFNPLINRESVYITIDFRLNEEATQKSWKINGIKIFGDPAGYVL